jgi:hypothetical protein
VSVKKYLPFAILLTLLPVSLSADSPLSQEKWTADQLANSRYLCDGKMYQLKNGKYFVNTEDERASYSFVRSLLAVGDLNTDGIPDYLVVLESSFGGSGIFPIAIARLSRDNGWVDTEAFNFPDRVDIKAASIRKGRVHLDMVVHSAEDGLCCPSVKTAWQLALSGRRLVKAAGVDDASGPGG